MTKFAKEDLIALRVKSKPEGSKLTEEEKCFIKNVAMDDYVCPSCGGFEINMILSARSKIIKNYCRVCGNLWITKNIQ
jgi:predicted RNA-binding Zn-ribbon protein involved in translation (DUF1610 family)